MTGTKFYDTADGNFADLARAAQVRSSVGLRECITSACGFQAFSDVRAFLCRYHYRDCRKPAPTRARV